MHRAPLNELRPVHHEAVFGAPGLSRTREGGFRYLISILYRKRLFFTPNASENASRTPGACFLHGTHIPYRRRPSPVPNSANARKEESIACTEFIKLPEKRRALPALNASSDRKEKGIARNMSRNAAASKKITASVPKTHRQTAPQLKDPPQLHTRPTKSTTNTKHLQHPQSPPQAVRKVRFSKCNRPSGPFWQG